MKIPTFFEGKTKRAPMATGVVGDSTAATGNAAHNRVAPRVPVTLSRWSPVDKPAAGSVRFQPVCLGGRLPRWALHRSRVLPQPPNDTRVSMYLRLVPYTPHQAAQNIVVFLTRLVFWFWEMTTDLQFRRVARLRKLSAALSDAAALLDAAGYSDTDDVARQLAGWRRESKCWSWPPFTRPFEPAFISPPAPSTSQVRLKASKPANRSLWSPSPMR